MGLAAIAVGLAAMALRLLHIREADWLLFAGMAITAAGVFGLFEARAGWCVVRAMGFKTRI